MKQRGGKSNLRKPEAEPRLDFAALRNFFSAYLHQDFREEYGSAAGAAAAFCKDAEPGEIAALLREWERWRKQLGDASANEVAAAIRRLEGAWQPQTLGDLDSVGTALKTNKNASR